MGKAGAAKADRSWVARWGGLGVAVLGGVLAVVVAWPSWWTWQPPDPVEVEVPVADPALVAEVTALEEGVAERDAEIVELMEERAELEMRLDTARAGLEEVPRPGAELAACREERDELQAGLERAVEELNRRRITIAGTGGAPPLTRSAAGPRSPIGRSSPEVEQEEEGPEPYRDIRTYSDRLKWVADEVVISGRLYNPDRRDQRVRVELALLRDGREVRTRTQTVLVPGKGHLSVAQRMPGSSITGSTYSARIRILR